MADEIDPIWAEILREQQQAAAPKQAAPAGATATGPSAPDLAQDPIWAEIAAEQQRETEMKANLLSWRAKNDTADASTRADVLRYTAAAPEAGLGPLRAEFVEKNLDAVKKQVDSAKVDWNRVAYRQPALVQYMLENPMATPLAKDDAANLGAVEWALSAPFHAFRDAVGEQAKIARQFAEFSGAGSPENRQAIAELEANYSKKDYGAHNFFTKGALAIARFIPWFVGDTAARALGAEVGAAVTMGPAAGAGAAGGAPAGGVGALPGAGVGALAGGVGGAVVGQYVASGLFNYYEAVGPLYDDLSKLRDANGEPLDPEVARAFAQTGAILQGGLMSGFMGKVGASLPGVRQLLAKATGQTLEKALVERSTSEILKRGAKSFGENWLTGAAMMGAQSALNQSAIEAAKDLSAQPFDAQWGSVATAGADGFVAGLQDMWLLSALGPGREMVSEVGRARRSAEEAVRLEAMTASANASKLLERHPESFQKAVEKMKEEQGAVENVFVPVEEWTRYWQGKKVDPGEVAADVVGDGGKAYADAVATKGDLAIPVEKYLAKLAKTEHAEGLAPDAKLRPDSLTARQVKAEEERLAARMAEEGKVRGAELEAGKKEVFDFIFSQAKAAGIGKTEAESNAKLVSEYAGALALRLGLDVREAAVVGSLGQLRVLGAKGEEVAQLARARFGRFLAPEASQLLDERLGTLSPENRARELFIDENTGLLNEKAFNELGGQGMVGHIAVEGIKFLNDTTSHDRADLLYRAVAKALHEVDPNAAKVGGDFAVRVKDEAQLADIVAQVKARLPEGLRGFDITGAVGADWKVAGAAQRANIDAAVARGERANPRPPDPANPGGKPLPPEKPRGLGGVDAAGLAFPEGRAAAQVPEALQSRVSGLSDSEYFKEAYVEPKTGLLTAEGWRAIPRKAHVAALDLKGLRSVNTRFGEEAGDEMLRRFGVVASHLGGSSFDFAHLHGDEYAAQHSDPVVLEAFLARLREKLKDVVVEAPDLDSGEVLETSIEFRSGIGKGSYDAADRELNAAKQRDQASPTTDRRGVGSVPGKVGASVDHLQGQGGLEGGRPTGDQGAGRGAARTGRGAQPQGRPGEEVVAHIEGKPVTFKQESRPGDSTVKTQTSEDGRLYLPDSPEAETWRMSLPPQSAPSSAIEAFALGRSAREAGYTTKTATSRDFIDWANKHHGYTDYHLANLESDFTDRAFFNAGLRGDHQPQWATGWRFGDVPTNRSDGAPRPSFNFRDQQPERGVSMAYVDGHGDTSDGTFKAFNGQQKKTHVGGFLIQDTGSDGEPLLVGAVELKPKDTGRKSVKTERSSRLYSLDTKSPANAPRGSIELQLDPTGRPVAFNINILNGDKSTLLHETAHFLSWSLHDVATSDLVTPDLKRDYDALLKWAGYDSPAQRLAETKERQELASKAEPSRQDKARERALSAKEERISHGWEQYLLEGKAPSEGLARVFSRFKGWLLKIYKGVAGLQKQYRDNYGEEIALSDDVRGLFGRLLAADAALEQARADTGQPATPPPLVTSAMSPTEREAYCQALVGARIQAEQDFTQRAKELEAQQAGEARQRFREEATVELDRQPVYRAQRYLVSGEVVDANGQPLEAVPEVLLDDSGRPFKLNRKAFVDRFGADVTRLMPAGIFERTKKGGVDVEQLAPLLGFESGTDLVAQFRKVEPRDKAIARLTQERMDAAFGPVVQAMADAAMSAVHSDDAARATLLALRGMAKQVDPSVASRAQSLNLDTLKKSAAQVVGLTAVDSLDPAKYARTERATALRAAELWGRGEKEKSLEQSEARLFNQVLYRTARDAKERLEKLQSKLESTSDDIRATLGQADPAYRDVHDAILAAVGFGEANPDGKSLDQLLTQADGYAQTIDFDVEAIRKLLARPKDWGALSVEEASTVGDAITNIRHLAKSLFELELAGKKQTKDSWFSEFNDTVKRRTPLPPEPFSKTGQGIGEALKHLGRGADAILSDVPETFSHFLDSGDRGGPVHRLLVDARLEAREKAARLGKEVLHGILEAWENVPKELKALRDQKADVAALLPVPPGLEGRLAPVYTRDTLWMLFLNWGNEGNRQRIRDGNGWTDDNVTKALSLLSKPELTFLKSIADGIASLYPELAAVHEKRTGLPLGKVELTPITLNGETYTGHYFPLKYRPESRPGEFQEGEAVKALFAPNYQRPAVSRGHTKARVERVVGAPVDLSWGVVPGHLAQVIHDISYGEWVRQAGGILLDPRFKALTAQYLGPERAAEFVPWLRDVANARADSASGATSKFLEEMGAFARNRTAMAVMGGNLPSILQQVLDPYNAAQEDVPVRHIATAYVKVNGMLAGLGDLPELKLSKELAVRDASGKEGLRVRLGEIGHVRSPIRKAMEAVAFHLYELSDRYTTRVTWKAAFDAALSTGLDDAAAASRADDVVRRVYASSDISEKPPIMRSKKGLAGAVMFYSFANRLYNSQRRALDDLGRALGGDNIDVGQAASTASGVAATVVARNAAKLMMLGATGAACAYLAGRGPKKDEDAKAWLAWRVLLEPLNTVPFLGPAVESLVKGDKISAKTAPELALLQDSLEGLGALAKKVQDAGGSDDEAKLLVAAEALVGVGLAGAGAPAGQIKRTAGYLGKVQSGESRPRNALDAASGVIYGEKSKPARNPLSDLSDVVEGR